MSGLYMWYSPSCATDTVRPSPDPARSTGRSGNARRCRAGTSCGDLVDADAADARRRVREVRIDEFLIQADRFEDLRAAIALQRRDAHLRHDFENALVDGLDVVVDRLPMIDAMQHVLPDHVVERFEGEIGIDRRRAVTDQQTVMMNFARFAGFDDSVALRARAFANQVVMHSGRGEQARDRRACPCRSLRSDRIRIVAPSLDRVTRLPRRAASIARRRPVPPSETRNVIGSVTDLKPAR